MTNNPPIHDVVCIGKLVTHSQLDDGRYNLLLLGAKRAKIIREISAEQPYRMAHVELIDDQAPEDESSLVDLRRQITDCFKSLADGRKVMEDPAIKNLLDNHRIFK